MNKIADKSLKIKAADVNINTEVLSTIDRNFILESISSNKVEGSSIDKNSKHVKLDKEII